MDGRRGLCRSALKFATATIWSFSCGRRRGRKFSASLGRFCAKCSASVDLRERVGATTVVLAVEFGGPRFRHPKTFA